MLTDGHKAIPALRGGLVPHVQCVRLSGHRRASLARPPGASRSTIAVVVWPATETKRPAYPFIVFRNGGGGGGDGNAFSHKIIQMSNGS